MDHWPFTSVIILEHVWVHTDNLKPYHLEVDNYVAQTMEAVDITKLGKESYNQILADISTSFTVLVGIFFPSVTGNQRRYHNVVTE